MWIIFNNSFTVEFPDELQIKIE